VLLIRIILEIYIVYFLFAAILNLSERLVSVGIMDKGFNPFMPTVPTFAVRETSLGQQMLEIGCENAMVGKNGLIFPP